MTITLKYPAPKALTAIDGTALAFVDKDGLHVPLDLSGIDVVTIDLIKLSQEAKTIDVEFLHGASKFSAHLVIKQVDDSAV